MDLGNDAQPMPVPSQQSINTAAGTRRYRSKSQRPCDLCRARKVLCNIPDPSKPCQLCDRRGRACTFLVNTNKKPRTTSSPNDAGSVSVNDLIAGHPSELHHAVDSQVQLTESESPEEVTGVNLQPFQRFVFDASWAGGADASGHLPTQDASVQNNSNSIFDILQDTELSELWPLGTPTMLDGQDFTTNETASDHITIPPSEHSSLDLRHNHSSSLIGYSNESDSFMLEHFPYNSADEVDFFMVSYRKPSRSSVSAGQPPIHFLQSKSQATSQGRDIIAKCMVITDERDQLEKLVDTDTGVALVRLYLKFIFQTLPILSRSLVLEDEEYFVKTSSPGLLAAIYALALPFTSWDEQLCMNTAYSKPSSDSLWQIAYTCLQKELHSPHLSTVQTCLLLLNHPPFDPVAVESPFAWSLASSMLAVAQSLGLHIDPTDWKIPPWEIRLRRRLWWAVAVEHSWRAITHGRPSALCDDDWNVTSLTGDDFAMESTFDSTNTQCPDYFMRLCSLTDIANSICRQFFSLRAVSEPQSLETLIEKAKWPRQQLLEWLESLPESLHIRDEEQGADGDESPRNHASLYVAYFTAHILILRAILRPIIDHNTQLDHMQSSVATVLEASRGLMHTMIKFVRGLDVKYKSGFWPAYTRHCFCYPGLFCYMLCLQNKEPHMTSYDRGLLATWRNMLRSRVQSWPLLRFAVVKVDALFWKKLDHLRDTSAAS